MQQRRFRFGLFSLAPTSKDWLEEARKAEDLGFDILYLGDHISMPLAVIPALLAAAQVTKTLRVGSYLFGNDFRHPMQLAKEVATVDSLTGGRFEFGIGAGWYPSDYQDLGIPFDPPITRIRRLEEAVQIFRLFFSGEKFEFHGKYYQVKNDDPLPKTVQKPLPITLGGGGKQILSLAARQADIVDLSFRKTREGRNEPLTHTREATQQKFDWICQAAGDRLEKIRLSITCPVLKITDTQAQANDILAQEIGGIGTADDVLRVQQALASPHYLIGTQSFLVDKILELRETFGISELIFWNLPEGAQLIRILKGK